MKKGLEKYIAKRAVLAPWTPEGRILSAPGAVVVIPALAEGARLFHTLGDLRAQAPEALARTQVFCVVNNRPPDVARAEDIEDNRDTLDRLRHWQRDEAGGLAVAVIDAASPGLELPATGGVGLARKIGMDHAAALLHAADAERGPIICLDADTRVAPEYLADIQRFYQSGRRWAGILPYAHPLEGPEEEQAAIVEYELFLRYHELGLRSAGSPYAFHTIGSTMTCTAEAYAAVSGMNQRQAGEDFYFLQQLAKTGTVQRIPAAPVAPSARASHRVPFGTGQRVQRFLATGGEEPAAYHPEIYRLLGQWLELAASETAATGDGLCEAMAEASAPFAAYLRGQQFPAAWDQLRAQSRSAAQLFGQFHRWFDGFRTLKCIHYLRDHGLPNMEIVSAIALLPGVRAPGKADTLAILRDLCQIESGEKT